MRKLLWVVLALMLAGYALAVTAHAQVFIRPGQLAQTWECSANALGATLTQCEALVAGERLYVTDIVVQTTTATSGTWSIQTGTGTNCGTATTALFPSSGTANRFNAPVAGSGPLAIHFVTPLRPTTGHAICVIGVATNTINIQIHGFRGF